MLVILTEDIKIFTIIKLLYESRQTTNPSRFEISRLERSSQKCDKTIHSESREALEH